MAADEESDGSASSAAREEQLAAGQSPVESQRWQATAAPLVVFVALSTAIAAVYSPGMRAPFIYDDVDAILTNHSIVRLSPLFASPGPLSPPHDIPTSGRPLVNLSLALNYAVGHFDPVGYHLFNYLVHALCATLIWALLRRVLRLDYFQGAFDRQAGWLAFGVALVWALHPLQTQSVECVTHRSELLVGLFYLGTMYASLRWFTATSAGPRSAWLVIATLACFAGMASKEVMATAPVMVALFERTFMTGPSRRSWFKAWPLYAALASSWILLIALNVGGPRSASAGFESGLLANVWWLTQCKVLALYFGLALWPSPLVFNYDLPGLETIGAAWPWVLAVAAAVAVTLVLLYRKRAAGFLGAWFFVILAPTLLVPILEVAAERRMYLSLLAIVTGVLIGGFKLLEWLASRVTSGAHATPQPRWPAVIMGSATLALAVMCGVASARWVQVYLDPVAVWQSVLDVEPRNVVAHLRIAEALIPRGRYDEAANHIQEIQSLAPTTYHYPHMAGTLAMAQGRSDEAIEHFRKVVKLLPNSASGYNNLGVAMNANGEAESAIPLFETALRLDPNYSEAHNNLATAFANQGKLDQALKHYALALQLNPELAGAHTSMGVILVNLGHGTEAIEHLEAAARLQPDVEAYAKLAIAYAGAGRIAQALESIEQSLSLARASGQTQVINNVEALKRKILQLQMQQQP